MSRKTCLWRKKIGREWTIKMKNGTRTLRSGNGGRIDDLIPTRANGTGLYLNAQRQDKSSDPRGRGNTCTLPMSSEKEARLRKLVSK